MSDMSNPFVFGKPVHTQGFIGRKQEIIEILDALRSGDNISVVGERRIGKSSLLQYATAKEVLSSQRIDTDLTVILYFDFQGYDLITRQLFWSEMLTKLSKTKFSGDLVKVFQDLKKSPDNMLLQERFFQKAYESGFRIVFVIDEFDIATANPNFDKSFYNGLRNLSKFTSFVVASHYNLSELYFSHPDALTSPFFNIFHRLPIQSFENSDVNALIEKYLNGSDILFDDNDRELIYFFGGVHPFFVQMACYYLYSSHQSKLNVKERNKLLKTRMWENSVEHFKYYWSKSSDDEKAIMAAFSLLEPEELTKYNIYPSKKDPHVENLARRALLLIDSNTDHPRIFSVLFQKWLCDEVSYIPVHKLEEIKRFINRTGSRKFDDHWIKMSSNPKTYQVDWKNVFNWLVVSGGVGNLLQWIQTLLSLLK